MKIANCDLNNFILAKDFPEKLFSCSEKIIEFHNSLQEENITTQLSDRKLRTLLNKKVNVEINEDLPNNTINFYKDKELIGIYTIENFKNE